MVYRSKGTDKVCHQSKSEPSLKPKPPEPRLIKEIGNKLPPKPKR